VAADELRSVFEAEHARLWRSLLAHTRDPEVASDAAAEAFAQAARRGAALRDPAAWVWRAAFRIAAGQLAARSSDSSPVPSTQVSEDTFPDDVVALLDALARLGATDRRIVVLSLVAGMSAAEVGSVVDASPGAVRVRLHRARKRLGAVLDADGAAGPAAPAGTRRTR
jgi:RNA polymerase sigma-70 factor (ECF subfamily)